MDGASTPQAVSFDVNLPGELLGAIGMSDMEPTAVRAFVRDDQVAGFGADPLGAALRNSHAAIWDFTVASAAGWSLEFRDQAVLHWTPYYCSRKPGGGFCSRRGDGSPQTVHRLRNAAGSFAMAQLRILAEIVSLTGKAAEAAPRIFVTNTLADPEEEAGWIHDARAAR